MVEIFKIELKMEFIRKDYRKRLLAFIGLVVFAFIMMKDTLEVNDITSISIIISISLISLFTSTLHMISKLRSKYISIWLMLPISRVCYFLIINIVSYIKYFFFKVFPFILAYIYLGLINKNIGLNYTVIFLLIIIVISILSTMLGGICALIINNINDNSVKSIEKSMQFNFNTFFAIWFRRECQNFIQNKLFFMNHFFYGAFCLIMIYSVSKSGVGASGISLFTMFLIHLSSTSMLTYSKDKNVWNIVNSLPISRKKLFFIKYAFNLTILVPIYLVTIFFINKITSISLLNLAICIFYAGLITTFIKVYIDYKSPILDWQHERQMFENKRKYSTWIMIFVITLPDVFIDKLYLLSIIIIQFIIVSICVFINYKKYKNEREIKSASDIK